MITLSTQTFTTTLSQNPEVYSIGSWQSPALPAIEAAIRFVRRNSSVITDYGAIRVSALEFSSTITVDVCAGIEYMITHMSTPDIAIVKTNSRTTTIVLKKLFRKLGMPTLWLFRNEKVPGWEDLSEDEEKYLIQIMPPSGIILNFVSYLVHGMNSEEDETAVVLVDKAFREDLFQEKLWSHSIIPISNDIANQLLLVFDSQKIHNVFVVGSLVSIDEVFEAACKNNFDGPMYHWFAVTNEEVERFYLGCGHMRITVIHPKSVNPWTQVEKLRKAQNISALPDVDMTFYFDATVIAMKAIAEMKSDGKWPLYMDYNYCVESQYMEPNIRKDLNLRHAISTTPMVPSYGHIFVSGNDDSLMGFALNFLRLKFSSGKLVYYNNLGTHRTDAPDGADLDIMKIVNFDDDNDEI